MTRTIVCSNCGKALRPGARFCHGCGKPAPPPEDVPLPEEGGAASGQPAQQGEPSKPAMKFSAPTAGAAAGFGLGALGGMMGGGGSHGAAPVMPGSAEAAPASRTPTRLERVSVLATWFGATRQFMIDRQPQTLALAVRKALKAVSPFGESAETFQNIVFQTLHLTAATSELLDAANAGLAELPPRFSQYLQDPAKAASLELDGGWKEIMESWPYVTYQMSWNVAPEVFSEMCVQTAYEGAFCLNLAPNGYLEEEEARIEAGMYPKDVALLLRRACSKIGSRHTSKEVGWGSTPDERADALVRLVAPQGHPEQMRKLTTAFGSMGFPNPLQADHLSNWELQHLYAFSSSQEYDRHELVAVLKGRWESLARQASRLNDAVYYTTKIVLQASLVMLAQCLNMQDRRLDPLNHADYAYALEVDSGTKPVDTIRAEMGNNSPELVKALWPESTSLFTAEYLVRKQQAG